LLSIALSLLSNLHVTALDSSPEMYALAQKNIRDRCMEDLVVPIMGDVHAIPAPDATFSLVVSRGSYHSWEDLPAAFSEVYRVLRPGGIAYIGGGYVSARIRDEVLSARKERGLVHYPVYPVKRRFRTFSVGEIEASMADAGISDFRIISDDSGFWILFRKGDGQDDSDEFPDEKPCPVPVPQFHDGFFFSE
jgi:SAM-dependent methyltransferase